MKLALIALALLGTGEEGEEQDSCDRDQPWKNAMRHGTSEGDLGCWSKVYSQRTPQTTIPIH